MDGWMDEYLCAVFFAAEPDPDPWPTSWCKSMLRKFLCLRTAQAHHRQTDRQTDRQKSDLNRGAFTA